MTAPSFHFDLVEEPWIPCETPSGERIELGLRAVLARAHELAAVHDESPLVTAVLHRTLLAILNSALSPTNREEWWTLWQAKKLPSEPIVGYLDEWHERFDLFHPERPFMQVSRLEERLLKERGKPSERTPVVQMVIETSRCGEHIRMFGRVEDDAVLTPAQAVRALLAFQAYTNGGRIQNEVESWQGGMLRGGAVILVRGASLRETLLLNLKWRSSRTADDVPPWQRKRDIERRKRGVAGPTDMLCWPARRVQLFPIERDGQTVIREVLTAAGENATGETFDPQFAYVVRDKKNEPMPIRFDPDRSPWRDASALFEKFSHGRLHAQPVAVEQVTDLIHARLIPRTKRFSTELLGMSSDKAAIRLWRAERLALPESILTDPNRVSALRLALEKAEAIGEGFDRSVMFVLCGQALAPGDREAHRNDIRNLKDALGAVPAYWSALGIAFPHWLEKILAVDDPDTAMSAWRKEIFRSVRCAFADASRRLGTTGRALQATALAENTLRKVLHEHLVEVASTTEMSNTPPGVGS